MSLRFVETWQQEYMSYSPYSYHICMRLHDVTYAFISNYIAVCGNVAARVPMAEGDRDPATGGKGTN